MSRVKAARDRFFLSRVGWLLVLLVLIPLQCTCLQNPLACYSSARKLFLRGFLEQGQHEAKRGYLRFRESDPFWAFRFRLLEAEAMSWRGMNEDAFHILSEQSTVGLKPEMVVQKLTLEGFAFTRLHQYPAAKQDFDEAENLCRAVAYPGCGELSRARGLFAIELGQLSQAKSYFEESLRFAQKHSDPWLEATALLNLGVTALQNEHYDEAIDWSKAAARVATDLDAQVVLLSTQGNLGWAYYKLGDSPRALEMYQDAQSRSIALGDIGGAIVWLTDLGYVYQETNELPLAMQSHLRALELARQINSKEDIITALEDLAHVSVEQGKLAEAESYLSQVDPLVQANGNRLDALDVMLARGKIAAARRDFAGAEGLFRAVEGDAASQTSMKLGAEHQLARLYQAQGRGTDAEGMFRTALGTFEGAREQLKEEDSKLPFLANAAPIYDDYVDFLVSAGKEDEALRVADQSRARTLAQGLGDSPTSRAKAPVSVISVAARLKPSPFKADGVLPQAVARKAGATLLFYWLGERRSYLWAVTPAKTTLFDFPGRSVVAPLVERYTRGLLGSGDPLELGSGPNDAGRALYTMLVAPVAGLIQAQGAGRPVMILADGVLSQLNFETLVVPEQGIAKAHYLIEDATLISAPSLAMLAAAKPVHAGNARMLLLGDAVSPGEDYPELPFAGREMQEVAGHFQRGTPLVFRREAATPGAYLRSDPGRFGYIHFVSHGVASRTDPLDSAIILSRGAKEDSFKLYAREVMRHPIDARLVTISACYGSGTRAYAGEGLVGLSWAFLRAGAHNAIGALWEASDESTPRLMGDLYAGLESGLEPGEALRRAKLGLLHSGGKFRRPFYWAPFQIYTRM